MEAQFKSGTTTSASSNESIQIGSSDKYRLVSGSKLPRGYMQFRYPLLLLLVLLALVLSVVSLAWTERGRGLIQSGSMSAQQRASAYMHSSSDCGGDENFKVLMNAFITEGIIDTPNSQELMEVSNDALCYQQCINVYGSNCSFFSVSNETSVCVISSADFYSTWTHVDAKDGAVSCYRTRPDQWKMLYRRPKLTKSGYTNEVTGPWTDRSYYTNDSLVRAEEAAPNSKSWTILKSQLTRYWESLDVSKVKVSLHRDGKEVHHLIFNARGSNSRSWFNMAFLLETSWKDLGPAKPPFYLGWWWKDSTHTKTCRSMYVASAHKGCPNDRMWMALIQNQLGCGCPWENVGERNVPRLLYAPGEQEADESDVEDADYVVISAAFPLSLSEIIL